MFGKNSLSQIIPPITKNLLIINCLVFLATSTFSKQINLNNLLGLHYWNASTFNIIQFFSYMFLHANFSHLFFNMFGLFMFGRIIEEILGSKRFLFYYLTCGLGAAIIQQLTWSINIIPLIERAEAVAASDIATPEFLAEKAQFLNHFITVGASGAVFGLLLAFGMILPEQPVFLMFIPIPIKAKYFVIVYAAIELLFGIGDFAFDNIAHFAHLGGMLFGYILIKYWRTKSN